MRQHLRPVDAFPEEAVMRMGVVGAPRELLRHHVVDAGFLEQLRQTARITEDVRQPQHPHVLAELLPEEPFAVQDLTHQRLAAGNVRIRLDPHRALRLPAALADSLLHFRVKLRIILFHPLVQLRLACAKHITRILLHVAQHSREGPCPFANRLADRPEPSQIDMRMADGADRQHGIAAFFHQIAGHSFLRQMHRLLTDLRQKMCCLVDGLQHLGFPCARIRQLFDQLDQYLQIVSQLSGFLVANGNYRFLQRPAAVMAEQVIAAAISPEVNGLLAPGGGTYVHHPFARPPQAVVELGTHVG
ncbi:hypothetical protein D3C81_1264940 [compost metagenome]